MGMVKNMDMDMGLARNTRRLTGMGMKRKNRTGRTVVTEIYGKNG